ncbi:MAG: serine hydrolase domain-containing protein [Desulfosoma sp.]
MTILENRLSNLVESAIAQKVFSGASALVSRKNTLVFSRCWGTTFFGDKAKPVTPFTLFDLASLTKPMATATLVMTLAREGRLKSHDCLHRIFPSRRIPKDKKSLTIEQLLSHRSGLPAYKPYFRELVHVHPQHRKDTLMEWVLCEPLITKPGTERLYSDLGYMLLGWILEELTDSPLDVLFEDLVRPDQVSWNLGYRRLGAFPEMKGTHHGPSPSKHPKEMCVATEYCPWRGRLLQGEVHDENAYCLQGVSGHAGLFGTARDVWEWSQKRISLFQDKWRLAFDTPSSHGSSAGRYFSSNTVGHLGFTGTSFWMDLDQEIMVILLTNRVHPHRHDERIRVFRPLFHDTVMEVMLHMKEPF